MKETWDRFDCERKKMRKDIDGLHQEVKNWRDKYEEERRNREKETE